MYVRIQLGNHPDEFCDVERATTLSMDDLLTGTEDHEICIEGGTSCQSRAEAEIEVSELGFGVAINGWGEAVGLDLYDAFSRHDITASLTLAAAEDLRVRVDWFHLAAGLGWVALEVRRIGDLDGGGAPSPPIIDRSASSDIDVVMEDGVDVLHLPAGLWRIQTGSSHQAMTPGAPGLQHAFARTTHTAAFVPLGDVDGSDTVDVADLLSVIDTWGPCDTPCPPDLDSDGLVGVTDVLMVLSDWGD